MFRLTSPKAEASQQVIEGEIYEDKTGTEE